MTGRQAGTTSTRTHVTSQSPQTAAAAALSCVWWACCCYTLCPSVTPTRSLSSLTASTSPALTSSERSDT